MKKKIAYLFLCLMFVGCASSSISSKLPETIRQACTLYQSVRPDVMRLREYAKDNWSAIPPNVQETLRRLDAVLPELDKAGQAACAISGGLTLGTTSVATGRSGVNWDQVLSTVMKAAMFAADLKKQGVI